MYRSTTLAIVVLFGAATQQVASFGPKNTTKAPPSSSPVTLLDFSGKKFYTWAETDDPVMGGQSAGSITVTSEETALFKGSCKIVPFLHAPGFCKATTTGGTTFAPLDFPDASHWIDGAMHLTVKTTTPEYKGFKIAFGSIGAKALHRSYGTPSYKSDFALSSSEWTTVVIPFSHFSIDWSGYTGACDTKDPNGVQHYCCSTAHPEVCPTSDSLAKIDGFAIWAEGSEGDFELELKSVVAGPLSTGTRLTPPVV